MTTISQYAQFGFHNYHNDILIVQMQLVKRSGGMNDTRVPQIWAITIIMFLAATTFVVARFYVRCNSGIKTLGFDDFMILLALIALSACGGMGLWGATLGFGRHESDIANYSLDALFDLQIVVVLIPVTYQFSLACVQFSILAFYARFFKYLRCASFIMMGIVVVFCTIIITGNVTNCHPIPGSRISICKQLHFLWYFSSGVGLALDTVIWTMPLPRLLKLNSLSRRKKVGIIAMFSVGASAIIISISRMMMIAAGARNDDKYWNMARLHIYNLIEVGIGIACACMPSLMPLLRRLLSWKRGRDCIRRRNSPVEGRDGQQHGQGRDGGAIVILKDNVLDSTYVEHSEGEARVLQAWKGPVDARGGRCTHISVADISGCGILESPKVTTPRASPCQLETRDAILSQPNQAAHRVGDWIELTPMPCNTENPQEVLESGPDIPKKPPPAEVADNWASTGSLPGVKILRRASSRIGDLLRPFSFERSRESWTSVPVGGDGDGWGRRCDISIQHPFSAPSPSHTTTTATSTRQLRASNSGEVLLLVRPSNLQQQQLQKQEEQHHNHHPAPSNGSSNTINTMDTSVSYGQCATASESHSATPSAHTTALSPRSSQTRESPWRKSIYPNPVEDQRGMLGLGDVDPIAGRILQLERIDTVDSVYLQGGDVMLV